MEALIYHFKIVMGELDIPKGEVYHAVEGGNGELGYYIISATEAEHLIAFILEDHVLFIIKPILK
jgi:NADH:ubiquinone oxidoreductase subunit D